MVPALLPSIIFQLFTKNIYQIIVEMNNFILNKIDNVNPTLFHWIALENIFKNKTNKCNFMPSLEFAGGESFVWKSLVLFKSL